MSHRCGSQTNVREITEAYKGLSISSMRHRVIKLCKHIANIVNISFFTLLASITCPTQLANSQLVKALLNSFNLFHADYIALRAIKLMAQPQLVAAK